MPESRRSLIALTALLGMAMPALAIEEADFALLYETVVKPWCESNSTIGSLIGEDGIELVHTTYWTPDDRGALVLFQRLSESSRKYCELAYDLRDAGFRIHAFDHRGQAFSERILPDPADHQKAYVDEFEDYVKDAKTFVETIVAPEHARLFALGHSLGGGILSAYAERHPEDFDALVVLVAPMLQPVTDPFPPTAAYLLARALTHRGFGAESAPTQAPYDPTTLTFEANTLTQSRARFEALIKGLFVAYPESISNVATNRWIKESMEGGGLAVLGAARLRMPILLQQADQDTRVDPVAQDRFCAWAADCDLRRYPGSRHNLLIETDSVRDRVLEDITAFLDRVAN